jgi:hypothetical protein
MSDAISSLVQKLLDSIGILKGPIFVVLTVLELLYLWHTNPFRVFTFLGQSPDILPILFLLWLLSGAFCFFGLIAWLGQYCKSFTKRHAERRCIYEKLQHHLTPEQEMILAQLLLPKHERHYFTHNDFVTDLVQSGIIDQSNVPFAGLKDDPEHNYSASYLCILSPVAQRYLEKHLYLLPKIEIEDGTYVIKRKNAGPYMFGSVEEEYGLVYKPQHKKPI